MKSLSCPNRQCPLARKASSENIIGHGFYRTNRGRRRRYRCSTCGKTFCSNTGTPYHRLYSEVGRDGWGRIFTLEDVKRLISQTRNLNDPHEVKRPLSS